MIPINFTSGGVAATIKCSNHRWGNVYAPEGGRAEMGILEIYDTNTGNNE